MHSPATHGSLRDHKRFIPGWGECMRWNSFTTILLRICMNAEISRPPKFGDGVAASPFLKSPKTCHCWRRHTVQYKGIVSMYDRSGSQRKSSVVTVKNELYVC